MGVTVNHDSSDRNQNEFTSRKELVGSLSKKKWISPEKVIQMCESLYRQDGEPALSDPELRVKFLKYFTHFSLIENGLPILQAAPTIEQFLKNPVSANVVAPIFFKSLMFSTIYCESHAKKEDSLLEEFNQRCQIAASPLIDITRKLSIPALQALSLEIWRDCLTSANRDEKNVWSCADLYAKYFNLSFAEGDKKSQIASLCEQRVLDVCQSDLPLTRNVVNLIVNQTSLDFRKSRDWHTIFAQRLQKEITHLTNDLEVLLNAFRTIHDENKSSSNESTRESLQSSKNEFIENFNQVHERFERLMLFVCQPGNESASRSSKKKISNLRSDVSHLVNLYFEVACKPFLDIKCSYTFPPLVTEFLESLNLDYRCCGDNLSATIAGCGGYISKALLQGKFSLARSLICLLPRETKNLSLLDCLVEDHLNDISPVAEYVLKDWADNVLSKFSSDPEKNPLPGIVILREIRDIYAAFLKSRELPRTDGFYNSWAMLIKEYCREFDPREVLCLLENLDGKSFELKKVTERCNPEITCALNLQILDCNQLIKKEEQSSSSELADAHFIDDFVMKHSAVNRLLLKLGYSNTESILLPLPERLQLPHRNFTDCSSSPDRIRALIAEPGINTVIIPTIPREAWDNTRYLRSRTFHNTAPMTESLRRNILNVRDGHLLVDDTVEVYLLSANEMWKSDNRHAITVAEGVFAVTLQLAYLRDGPFSKNTISVLEDLSKYLRDQDNLKLSQIIGEIKIAVKGCISKLKNEGSIDSEDESLKRLKVALHRPEFFNWRLEHGIYLPPPEEYLVVQDDSNRITIRVG